MPPKRGGNRKPKKNEKMTSSSEEDNDTVSDDDYVVPVKKRITKSIKSKSTKNPSVTKKQSKSSNNNEKKHHLNRAAVNKKGVVPNVNLSDSDFNSEEEIDVRQMQQSERRSGATTETLKSPYFPSESPVKSSSVNWNDHLLKKIENIQSDKDEREISNQPDKPYKPLCKSSDEEEEEEEEEEWEEVEVGEEEVDKARGGGDKMEVKKCLEITITNNPSKKTKKLSAEALLKRETSRIGRERGEMMHRIQVICLLSHARFVNNICSASNLMHFALSHLSLSILNSPKSSTCSSLKSLHSLVGHVKKSFPINVAKQKLNDSLSSSASSNETTSNLRQQLSLSLQNGQLFDAHQLLLIFLLTLRALHVNCRLVIAIDPTMLMISSTDQQLPSKSIKGKTKKKIISPDKDESFILFCDIYLSEEDAWCCIDQHLNIYTKSSDLCQSLPLKRLLYVFGLDFNGHFYDLSSKYDENWSCKSRKNRLKEEQLQNILHFFQRGHSIALSSEALARDKEEANTFQLSLPLPTSISDFKCHPLYVLPRHLLKYEIIHPADQQPVAFIKEEPIFPRASVFLCHTRETWLKEARVIRENELPAKRVKAVMSVKRKLLQRDHEPEPQVELFGEWQTEAYRPPVAVNGIVPRNEHGNVDLFKLSMLPINCAYLRLPGLGKVAKKLGIDAVPAMTGWEFHGAGWAHPIMDGFVVCQEMAGTLRDAWKENWREEKHREMEKRKQKIWANWKRIIKTLLIRARLRSKYDFQESKDSESTYVSSIAKGMQEKMKWLEEQSKIQRRK